MLGNEIVLIHSLFSNQKVYALLLGSGISRPAGIATGWDLTLTLIRRIALLEKKDPGTDPAKWFVDYFKEEPDYSNILQHLTLTSEERLNLLKPFFEPTEDEKDQELKRPTIAHRKIALLIQQGYIKVIITTNFDRLLESAVRELGIEPTIISNPNQIESAIPLIHSNCTIIKINGDYLDTKFLNLKSELSGYDNRMENLLKEIFENFGLISVGWSGQWDIALVELLRSSHKFRFSTFFTYLNTVSDKMQELAEFRNAKLIQIKNADLFFDELTENLDALSKNISEPPLTKELALARLKKYITKAEYEIQLHDLINAQLESAFQLVNSVNSSVPDIPKILYKIKNDTKSLDTITVLCIQGVYWGRAFHHKHWIRILKKLSHPLKQALGSYEVWNNLLYYPSLYLLYALGVSAILRRDFKLLLHIYNLTPRNIHSERMEPFQTNIHPYLLDPKLLNEVFSNKQFVPMSEWLYNELKPYFNNLITASSDYDDAFDYFEIINSLMFLKKINLEFAPMGRFLYRRRNEDDYFNLKFTELEKYKGGFELVESELFPDYDELHSIYLKLIAISKQSYR
ncbi:MAG: SIR2 family protein [Flavisolibacter sp.]